MHFFESDAETSYTIFLKRCTQVKSTVLSERIVSAVYVCYFKKANFQRSFTFFSLDRLSEQHLRQTIQVSPPKIKRGQKMPEIGFRNENFLLRVSRGELLGSIDFSLSHLLMTRRSIGRDSIIRDKILDKRTLKPWFGRADDDERECTLDQHWNCASLSICLILPSSFNFPVGSAEVN